jgi:hypothetical protein
MVTYRLSVSLIFLKMRRLIKTILLWQLFLMLAGCAQLPEYARPRVVDVEDRQFSLEQAFTYRTLSIDDFQAQSLPEDLVSHARNIAAHACCRIRTTNGTRYKITRGYLNQQIHYFGSILSVDFEAVMNPDCSWLNPDIAGEKLEYVLQHEQIHFALMELAARELNRAAKEEVKNFIAIQSTRKAARDEMTAKIKDMVRTATDAVLIEHTAFDEDTSMYFDPESQQRWFERVEEKLILTVPPTRDD